MVDLRVRLCAWYLKTGFEEDSNTTAEGGRGVDARSQEALNRNGDVRLEEVTSRDSTEVETGTAKISVRIPSRNEMSTGTGK